MTQNRNRNILCCFLLVAAPFGFVCLCFLVLLIASATGIIPNTSATRTAEYNATRDASLLTATVQTWTPTFTPTKTPIPSRTPIPTRTSIPTRTPQPLEQSNSGEHRYIAGDGSRVNLRSGAGSDFTRVGALPFGTQITILSETKDNDGEVWYEISFEGSTAWVAGWLTTRSRPVSNAQPPSNGSSDQGLAPNPPPAIPAFSCDCSKTCEAMSCNEAYFQLQTCGCGRRDGDSDGVPCESICPGG